MPFVPVPNTAEVVLDFTYHSQKCANVLHAEFVAPPDETQLTALANDVADWWFDELQLNAPDTLVLNSTRARDLTTQSGMGVEVPWNTPGTSTNPALPGSVTFAVTWITALRGRSFRGRTYHVGLREDAVVGNALTGGNVTAYTAIYTALRTKINSVAGRVMVVVSKYSGVDANGDPIPRVTGVTTPITGLRVEGNIDSQRRRLAGRGS